ncbi:hypothetical protein IBE03_05575, partial [Francisella tularensis]|nr:hypothetical protein [Francisella tularensis]
MKKVITFSVLFLCSIFGYSDNNLNQQTGMYYITANNFFYHNQSNLDYDKISYLTRRKKYEESNYF